MFTSISMAGTGTAVVIIQAILSILGIEAPEGSVAGAVDAVVTVVGFVLLVWGQLRRKDLVAGFIRK